jgi:hypothetical protein
VDTFSGNIVRSITVTRTGFLQLFQWFDLDRVEWARSPVLGDLVLHEYSFKNAPQLATAIIYNREILVSSEKEATDYFANNISVQSDTKQRALIADSVRNWPSDEECLAGFAEMHPENYLQDRYGTNDPDWDEAAALGFQWLIARGIVSAGDSIREILCWAPTQRSECDSDALTKVKTCIDHAGFSIIGDSVEFFQSHSVRPFPGMTVFQISQRSALERELFMRSLHLPPAT